MPILCQFNGHDIKHASYPLIQIPYQLELGTEKLKAEALVIMFVPPLFALGCSFYSKSKVALWIVRLGSYWYLFTFSIFVLFSYDCSFSNYAWGNCRFLPDVATTAYDAIHIPNTLSYSFVAPVLVLIALGFEIYARRLMKKSRDANSIE